MPKIIISDTSCLIVLSKINELEILQKLYKTLYTTPEIASEFEDELPFWIEILKVQDKIKQNILETQIDLGESSAIALACELADCTIILNDFKARKIAKNLGLTITGTFGIILKAKEVGIIESVKGMLEKIKNINFRLSEELENEVLKLANEN